MTVAATTVASTTIEITTTTAPTVAPATTATSESIALDAPSKKLPEPAESSNGSGDVQQGDNEPIDASISSPATQSPPVEEKLTQPQPFEGDKEELGHATAAEPEPMNLMPSAFPVDDVPTEITSHEPPPIEAER